MSKKYRLLKDLPYIKSGVEYVSADGFNGVYDRCSYVPNKMGMMHERFAIHIDWIENNPEWFEEIKEEQPKSNKDRIEVNGFYESGGFLSNVSGESHTDYRFNTMYPIPKEKFPLIKQAIEGVLNNDDNSLPLYYNGKRVYTDKELTQAMEDSFNAARIYDVNSLSPFDQKPYALYQTFQSYLNSLSNKK